MDFSLVDFTIVPMQSSFKNLLKGRAIDNRTGEVRFWAHWVPPTVKTVEQVPEPIWDRVKYAMAAYFGKWGKGMIDRPQYKAAQKRLNAIVKKKLADGERYLKEEVFGLT